MIASNRVGKDDDLWFCGNSAIIDPRGVVIAAASADREELIQADLSQELVRSVRQTDTGYAMPVIQKHASDWKTGFVPGLQQIASNVAIAIVSGVSERAGSSIYNSQVLIDAKGDVAAKYRKTHLYAVAPVAEQTCFAPGNSFASFELGGLKFGLSICYDLRFPELYPKVSHRKQRRRFHYFLRMAISANRTLVCAYAGARDRKPSLCDCVESCRKRR